MSISRRTFIKIVAATAVVPSILVGSPKVEYPNVRIKGDILYIKDFDLTEFGNRIPKFTGIFTETGFDMQPRSLLLIYVSDIRETEKFEIDEVQISSENPYKKVKYYINNYRYSVEDIRLKLPKLLMPVRIYADNKLIYSI